MRFGVWGFGRKQGSCVRSQLYRAIDFEYINKEDFDILIEQTDKISRKISTLIQYLKNSTFKGAKFKN